MHESDDCVGIHLVATDYNHAMAECVRCGAETELVESGLPVCLNCIDAGDRPAPKRATAAEADRERKEEPRRAKEN